MTYTLPAAGQVLKWLGGPIDVRVEIDTGLAGSTFGLWDVAEWDVDTWGAQDPDWADISEFVELITIDRGTERWGQRFNTGTCSIVLDDRDGRFTPDSGVDPFHLPFRPGRRMRVVAIPDVTDPLDKKPLFTGFIDASNDTYDEAGNLVTTTLECLDYMATWSVHNPFMLETPTGVQDTDERVTAALDRMSWDMDLRDIQTGLHTIQSSHLAQSTLEECSLAADAEGGAFFCSHDGKATFRARDWLSVDTRSVQIQAYLGYDEIPDGSYTAKVTDIQTSWEAARIINQVSFARVGSHMQEVEDTDSQVLYDIRSYKRTDLRNNADSEVLFLANRYLSQFKENRARIDQVTVSPLEDLNNEDLNHLFWDTQFGDLFSIKVEPPYGWGYEKLAKVMGITHRITSEDWSIDFKLDDVFVFVGGSVAQVTVDPQGGGENPNREGASEALVQVDAEGAGALAKAGGSEAAVFVATESAGTIPRAALIGLLAPEAWWRFGTGASTTVDSSGNGHTLTYGGSPTPFASGGPIEGEDRYVAFNGSSDFATVADEAPLELRQDMSIECWVRPHAASGADQCIISVRAAGDPLYEIFYAPSIDWFSFYPASSAGDGLLFASGSASNVWHHVVVTIDWSGANRISRRYKNGSLVGGPTTHAYQPGVATRVVNIGRRAIGNDLYFDGDISELAIFDRVLTADEVRQLYESTYL